MFERKCLVPEKIDYSFSCSEINGKTSCNLETLKSFLKKEKEEKEKRKDYFGNINEIQRGNISSVKFIKKIFDDINIGKINLSEAIEIIEYAYYQVFKNEIKFGNGKKGFNLILKNDKILKGNFDKVLGINNGNLFLICWVESNGLYKSTNEKNATGPYQIVLDTAKLIDDSISEEDLIGFNKSSIIAAKILKLILDKLNGKSYNDKIEKALTKYNGNFSSRLQEKYRTNLKESIVNIFNELYNIKSELTKTTNISEIKTQLLEIHNKYYIHSGNGNGNFPGTSHFGILEKKGISKEDIDIWIKDYLKKILIQQFNYSLQFNAINKLYKEVKKAN